MPLPPALAAKLSKRGIFQTATQRPDKERKRDYKGVAGCPNKSNIFHDCNSWCEAHWKPANLPPTTYVRNVGKLLMKYSLPRQWTEVFDKGMKRYYYWDMETDIVSWLPPKHPRAFLSESAAKLRERRLKGEVLEERIIYKFDDTKNDRKRSSKTSRRDRDKRDIDRKDKHDDKGYRKRSHREDIIDPMDPAAYSDIPIGTWSDGLEGSKNPPEKPADSPSPTKKVKKVNFN